MSLPWAHCKNTRPPERKENSPSSDLKTTTSLSSSSRRFFSFSNNRVRVARASLSKVTERGFSPWEFGWAPRDECRCPLWPRSCNASGGGLHPNCFPPWAFCSWSKSLNRLLSFKAWSLSPANVSTSLRSLDSSDSTPRPWFSWRISSNCRALCKASSLSFSSSSIFLRKSDSSDSASRRWFTTCWTSHRAFVHCLVSFPDRSSPSSKILVLLQKSFKRSLKVWMWSATSSLVELISISTLGSSADNGFSADG